MFHKLAGQVPEMAGFYSLAASSKFKISIKINIIVMDNWPWLRAGIGKKSGYGFAHRSVKWRSRSRQLAWWYTCLANAQNLTPYPER